MAILMAAGRGGDPSILGVFPSPQASADSISGVGSIFRNTIARLMRSHAQTSKVAMGFCTGFLPCMLSWAMVVKAATTGNVMNGITSMAAFGLSTAPILLFAGFFASSSASSCA
jgi:sulfite exporter TauE/SafE